MHDAAESIRLRLQGSVDRFGIEAGIDRRGRETAMVQDVLDGR